MDKNGTITIRHAGRLLHLGVGRAHAGARGIALANGPDIMILEPGAGEIIAEFLNDPDWDDQPG